MAMTAEESAVFDRIAATRDAVTVKRVFGDAYQQDGLTVIPVAAVRAAGGGGAGTGPHGGGAGTGPHGGGGRAGSGPPAGEKTGREGEADRGPDGEPSSGSGGGMGYAMTARPLGVYVIDGQKVRWRPVVDVMRLVLASEAAVIVGLVVVRRLLRSRGHAG